LVRKGNILTVKYEEEKKQVQIRNPPTEQPTRQHKDIKKT